MISRTLNVANSHIKKAHRSSVQYTHNLFKCRASAQTGKTRRRHRNEKMIAQPCMTTRERVWWGCMDLWCVWIKEKSIEHLRDGELIACMEHSGVNLGAANMTLAGCCTLFQDMSKRKKKKEVNWFHEDWFHENSWKGSECEIISVRLCNWTLDKLYRNINPF